MQQPSHPTHTSFFINTFSYWKHLIVARLLHCVCHKQDLRKCLRIFRLSTRINESKIKFINRARKRIHMF